VGWHGFPEALISGNEVLRVDKFIGSIAVVKGAVTSDDVAVYAQYLCGPGHLVAIGAEGSLGDFVVTIAKDYASDVTGVVIANSGHWIYDEHPNELTRILLDFL
jgi:pimeloyl-ACP methyl ester carboxylesterase